MITKILKVLIPLLFTVLIYAIVLKVYPWVWVSIDKFTWTNFSSSFTKKTSDFFGNFWWVKDNTDNVIDWVWTNTKSRSRELQKTMNEMKNSSR